MGRRRRWLRWLVRGVMAGGVSVAAGGAVAYWKRTAVVNRLLHDAVPGLVGSIRESVFDFPRGGVVLRGVVFRDPKTGREPLRMAELRATGAWSEWAHGRPGSVELRSPEIDLTPEVLAALSGENAVAERTAAGPVAAAPAAAVPWLRKLTVTDGKFRMGGGSWPRVEAAFDLSGGELGAEAVKDQRWRVHRLVWEMGVERAEVVEAETVFSADPVARRLQIDSLRWVSAKVVPLPPPDAVAKAGAASPASVEDSGKGGSEAPGWTVWVGVVDLPRVTVDLAAQPGRPAVRGAVALAGHGLRWAGAADWSAEAVSLEARDGRIGAEKPLLAWDGLTLAGSGDAGRFVVSEARWMKPVVGGSPETLACLKTPLAQPSTAPSADPAKTAARVARPARLPEIGLANWKIEGAELSAERLADMAGWPLRMPDVTAKLDASGSGLVRHPDGRIASAQAQTLTLSAVRAAFDRTEPFATFDRAALAVIPDDFAARREVASLVWEKPIISVTGGLLKQFQPVESPPAAPAAAGPSAPASPAAVETGFSWRGLQARELAVRDGRLHLGGFSPDFPEIGGKIEIGNRLDGQGYRIEAKEVKISPAGQPGAPLAAVEGMTAEVGRAGVWDGAIEALSIDRAHVTVGASFTKPAAAAPEPEASALPEPTKQDEPAEKGVAWRVGQLRVRDSDVNIADIVPLLDPAIIHLPDQTIDNLALTREGLLAQKTAQKVELDRVQLYSAYGNAGSVPVATFSNIFLHFSLAGLMEQRIDRVEVLNPTVHIGEPLFFYIDYFRKYAEQRDRERKAPAQVALASTNPEDTFRAAAAVVEATPKDDDKGWSVGQLDAYYGKLRLALKGSVVDSLPAMPFSCSSQLDRGKVALLLEVPAGRYRPVSRLQLEIDVEHGECAFNLPLPAESNNLVQTFKASEVRYKQLKASDVWLTVTYDRDGIYGKLGGGVYGGEVYAGFDLYLDDNLTWDGWVEASKVEVKALTDILTPEYLKMSGKTSVSLKAYGDSASLYTANGKLWTTTPGHMHIGGLDRLKEKLPETWTQLERSLTGVGFDAIRDCPFDTCTGEFTFYGREGKMRLDVRGKEGSRHVEVTAHDRRAESP